MNADATTDQTSISKPDTSTDPRPWLFKPGDTRINRNGRPPKGETIADKVARADAKVARKAIRARDKRLELQTVTGAREWSTYLAYNLGLPAQKHLIVNASADAAVSVLLQRMQVLDTVSE